MSARIAPLFRFHDPARGPFEPHTPRGARRDMSPPPPPPARKRLQPFCHSCGAEVAVHEGLCLTCNPPLHVQELLTLDDDLVRAAQELDIDLSGVSA